MQLPVRVRGWTRESAADKILQTESVSKNGVYFVCQKPFVKGRRLQVIYPYWEKEEALNEERPAEVVSVEKREGGWGVAVKFLDKSKEEKPS